MTAPSHRLTMDSLRALHAGRRTAIVQRLSEFSAIRPTDYFYELVYCLLTPQSSAINAEQVVQLLRAGRFESCNIDPEPLLRRKEFYIRFHKTKAKHLLRVKEDFPLISQHLANGTSPSDLRMWLVKNVNGLGWKEASHFLRNIGYRDLAILDRHILRNLYRMGVLKKLPKSLTPRLYLSIEKRFKAFAERTAIPMDELDLLFWSMETGEIRK